MADASLEAPAQGGFSPQAGGPQQPHPQEIPAGAGRPEDYLEVKAEKDRATLLVRSGVARAPAALERETVAARLRDLKVTAGVDWTAIDGILAAGPYDRAHVIAASLPPGETKDAWIEEKIKIDPDVKPVVGRDGHADYKNVDNIHQVKQGDVLAVKHPAVQGRPGMDIHGKVLSAPMARDLVFQVGANTEVSPDGLQLVAATGGYVYHQGGAICVGVTYTLQGDVDFHTGNLHYEGDILVKGNVTDGFTVEAKGDITVEGSVDGARIIAGGSVTVKSACFGHGKGSIKAGKSIRLLSVQDMDLECEGEIFVEKSMLNCKAVAGVFRADRPGCVVMGGSIKAWHEVHLAVMGGENCRTEVRVVDRLAEEARARLAEIEKKSKALAPKLEPLEKKLKSMKALAERAGGGMSPRALGELKATLEAYAALRKELASLEAARKEAAAATHSLARHTGRFTLSEKLVWGGWLEMYGHPRELQAGDEKKEWVWVMDGLAGRTMLPEPAPGAPGGPPPRADAPS